MNGGEVSFRITKTNGKKSEVIDAMSDFDAVSKYCGKFSFRKTTEIKVYSLSTQKKTSFVVSPKISHTIKIKELDPMPVLVSEESKKVAKELFDFCVSLGYTPQEAEKKVKKEILKSFSINDEKK